jgi:hypothetical protein
VRGSRFLDESESITTNFDYLPAAFAQSKIPGLMLLSQMSAQQQVFAVTTNNIQSFQIHLSAHGTGIVALIARSYKT